MCYIIATYMQFIRTSENLKKKERDRTRRFGDYKISFLFDHFIDSIVSCTHLFLFITGDEKEEADDDDVETEQRAKETQYAHNTYSVRSIEAHQGTFARIIL